MSKGFNWFKKYEIIHKIPYNPYFDWYGIEYLDGDSTSHSVGNIIKVQNLIEKYSGKRIPVVNEDWIDSVIYKLDLINPEEMVEICNKILADEEVDKVDMRHRIEWFKKLSEEGYYLTYDFE